MRAPKNGDKFIIMVISNGQPFAYYGAETMEEARDVAGRTVSTNKQGSATIYSAGPTCKLPSPAVEWDDKK